MGEPLQRAAGGSSAEPYDHCGVQGNTRMCSAAPESSESESDADGLFPDVQNAPTAWDMRCTCSGKEKQ